jgi:hypothetical protein
MAAKPSYADLEHEVERLRGKLKDAEQARIEAYDLVAKMGEHLEDWRNTREQWIDAFDMQENAEGKLVFTIGPGDVFDKLMERTRDYNNLVRRWNAHVGPFEVGRPPTTTEAQNERVRALRKEGKSLRQIAAATELSFAVVRRIVNKVSEAAAAKRKRKETLRREHDRLRAASYRARQKALQALPKQINAARKEGDTLLAKAKGALARR